MNALDTQFVRILDEQKVSLTKARQAVFATLLDTHSPLGIRELIQSCPVIDRASVYRTVTLFEQLGIVQRVYSGWKYRIELSDIFQAHHHHATCLGCGETIALPKNDAIEQMFAKLTAAKEFTMTKHILELQGYCHKCRVSDGTIADIHSNPT